MASIATTRSTSSIVRAALAERASQNRLRALNGCHLAQQMTCLVGGRTLVNFCSNDYLGLSKHPLLKERSIKFTEKLGTGSTSSRLVCGNSEIYESLEATLARLKGYEAALVFSSGYQLNASVMETLETLASAIYCDRLVHASLLRGAQASGLRARRFAHNNLTDLRAKLEAVTLADKSPWIVTESVFGMDGETAPLKELTEIAKDYNADLFVDEAHATGLYGESGMGLTAGLSKVTIAMGTFGKALGSFGGYLACSNELKQFFINFCPGFIYSTALPPAVLGAIEAALELVPTLGREREYLASAARELRLALKQMDFDLGASDTHIIPIIVGDDLCALRLAQFLEVNGILARAIRYPTVAMGKARVRLSLSAAHSTPQIEHLLKVLKEWRDANH